MARRLIPLLLAACWTAPPAPVEPPAASDPQRLAEALAAWERGAAALEAGDAVTARQALTTALAARPDDGLLILWLSRAERAAGDPASAYARLDAWLAAEPGDGLAAWQRASWRSLDGRLAEAADDLRTAIASGLLTPRSAIREPELAALAGQPGLPPLPERPVDVASSWEEVDGTTVIRWVIRHAPASVDGWKVSVTPGATVVSIDEASAREPDGDLVTTLAVGLRGPRPVALGPGVVELGAPVSQLAEVPVTGPGAPGEPLEWPLPSQVLGARAVPSAWAGVDGVWIALGPGVSAGTEPTREPGFRASLRKMGEAPVELVYVPGRVDTVSFRTDGGDQWVVEVR